MPHLPKILIIDDEPRMCESLKLLLGSRNYELKSCNTLKAAIEYLETDAFDLVLLDLILPDISGYQTIDYIKHKNPDALIIVITGQVLLESAVDALKHGVYDIFKKPFEPDNLLSAVKNAIDHKKLVSERKKAERLLRESELKFRTFFDLSPQAVILTDVETEKIFDINPKFAALVHFTKEEAVGKSPVELGIYSKEDDQNILEILKRADEVPALEINLSAKDGSVCNTLMSARRFQQEGRTYLLLIFNDITEQKKIESQYQKSLEPEVSDKKDEVSDKDIEDIIEAEEIILLTDERESLEAADTPAAAAPSAASPTIEPLILDLNDTDSDVRREAAGTLGVIGDPRAVAPLISALQDPIDDVRREAASALGMIGDPRAVEPLIILINPDKAEIDDQHVDKELDLFSNFDDFDLDFETEDRTAEHDVSVQIAAAAALGMIADPRAVDPLIAALNDDHDDVRREAAVALGMIADRRAVDPLIAALGDYHDDVRREAAAALGMVADPRAVDPLIAALNDRQMDARREAAAALGKIGDLRAVEPLIKVVQRLILKKHDAPIEEELNLDLNWDDLEMEFDPLHQEENQAGMLRCLSKSIIMIGETAVAPLMQVLESEDNDQELNRFVEDILDQIKGRLPLSAKG